MFISLGRLTKKSLFFLALPIIAFIRRLLSDSIHLGEANNMFYIGFIKFLGRSLNGILWIILKRRTLSLRKKEQNIKKLESTNHNKKDFIQNNPDKLCENESDKYTAYTQCKLDHNKIIKKSKRKKLFLLIFVCILDFFASTCRTIITKIKLYKERTVSLISLTVVIRLFSIAILSHFIIENINLYNHRYLSIIILLLVEIIIHIISYFTEVNKNYLQKLGLMSSPELLFSIMYVFGEKYLSKTKGNIFKLIFIDGIIGMFLSILFQIIAYFFIPCISCNNCENHGIFIDDTFDCDKKRLKTMIKVFINFDFEIFGYSILLAVATFLETWFIWLIILSFSVNHFGAIHTISLYIHFLLPIINNKEEFSIQNYIMLLLGGVIISFMSLVYNEIIILNFCGLDKNTDIEIDKRGKKELEDDFGEDDEEIYTKVDENYLINKEDIGRASDINLGTL